MMKTENNQNIFNRSDAITFEEIQASTDLSGKIASAESLKECSSIFSSYITSAFNTSIASIIQSNSSKHIINFTSVGITDAPNTNDWYQIVCFKSVSYEYLLLACDVSQNTIQYGRYKNNTVNWF